MATPSVTPKPERRNRIIRQSLYQEENKNHSKFNQTKLQQQLPNNLESFEKYTRRSGPPQLDVVLANKNNQEKNNINLNNTSQSTTYHQICLPQDSYLDNTYEFTGGGGCEGTQPSSFGNKNENNTKRFPLLYRVQMLRGFEVLCKRLLFHLVKASAASPKCFMVLPFALIGLSLVLGSFSSSWPSSFFPFYDIFHFGIDSNGECIKTFFPTNNCQLGRKSFLFDSRDYNYFPSENPSFDAPQHNPHNEFTILLTTKINIKSGSNLLLSANETLPLAFAQLFGQIQDSTIQHHKQIYKWWDLCQQCHLDKNLAKWFKSNFNSQNLSKNETEALNHSIGDEKTKENLLDGIYGDEALTKDGPFKRVHSLIMRIKLKRQLKQQIVDSFERNLKKIVADFSRHHFLSPSQEKQLNIYFWSAQLLTNDIETSLRQTHFKIIISWLALCGILSLAQFRANTYESRPMLGIQQAITILFASVCAYAVHLTSSERFNSLLFVLPFTITSVASLTFASVDSAFGRYSGIAMHPTEKMAFLFIWDGCAVVLPLLWLIIFCLFSSLLVQSVFLLQFLLALSAGFASLLLFSLTFLLVCWLETARRMAAGLKWFQICRTGDQSFNEKQFFDYDAYTCARLHEKLADLRPSFGRRFGHLVCGQNFKMLSFGLFCILCIGVGIGIATNTNNANIRLEASHFLFSKSQSQMFLENFYQSFPNYENFIEFKFDGPIDYEERKDQIFSLLNWPVEIGLATKAVSWLIEFEKFKKTVAYRIDEESSVSLLTHVFLRDERYSKFSADLHVSQGKIHKSRMYLNLNFKGRQQSEFLIRSLIEKAHRVGLDINFEVPFSFSISHDIQVIPKIFTSILWLCTLSAILCALQPALAICLFISNLFLCASVNTCFYLFNIPMNILTLGVLSNFGLPLNSVCILHFSHHFFNSGPLQQNNYLRIQYAFQCSLWPICLSTFIGPLSFCAELIFGNYPPIVLDVFKVLSICSIIILVQTFVFLPSLLPMFSDLFHDLFTIASQLCDENANAEMTINPMAENVYFVRRQQPICPTTFNGWNMGAAFGYGYPIDQSTFSLGGAPTNLSIPPAYRPAPIDYFPLKTHQNNNNIQHSRQTSRFSQQDQNNNSPRISSSCGGRSIHTDQKERNAPPPPFYSPPNIRKDNIMINGCCSKTDSGHNSYNESLESQHDKRIRHLPNQQQKHLNNGINKEENNKTNIPRSHSTHNFQVKYPSKFVPEEEQIYEEPDSPITTNLDQISKINKNTEINICAGAVARAKTRLTH